MIPITEDILRTKGWEVTLREKGYLFLEIQWNPFQRMKITHDGKRKQWRLHYMYNDTDVAFMEDIDTLVELWGHAASVVGLRLRPRTED